eukprot:CAMPEP_0174935812 /NCGR_PEP_ID=MMETSP1355-20121228/55066_1 /TAXON_ID=464990 /ORGANISM="Hemiselmis tepida, Strain CCMP443" /LENGTH=51 /DNA_ID=CAMNT_0016182543 /DNA_START=135 /DNA_END=290 /DNA_ORIENTATION=+
MLNATAGAWRWCEAEKLWGPSAAVDGRSWMAEVKAAGPWLYGVHWGVHVSL